MQSHFFSSFGAALILLVAQALSTSGWINANGAIAFSTSPLPSTRGASRKERRATDCERFGRNNHRVIGNTMFASKSNSDTDSGTKQMILVLGGSGYIGRRVCQKLVEESSHDESTRVVSISRNGKPPSWAIGIDGDSSWSDKVEWIRHEIGSESTDRSLAKILESVYQGSVNESMNGVDIDSSSSWETTIVGCIGNVNPSQEWTGLWGLSFDDDRLFEENGSVYESFLNQTESLRAENILNIDRCVLLSHDYVCQKCLEGPIEGYMDGKRLAERRLLEAVAESGGGSIADPSNLEQVVVVGLPNFVFGGKRFPTFGKLYRTIVESPIAKAYVGGNRALRSLSYTEDWVEAMLFSSPVDVQYVGRATAMAARGLVTRNVVNNGEPRKQGFFNISGLPIEYDDILFVDGAHEIEALVETIQGESRGASLEKSMPNKVSKLIDTAEEPLWEGALIGKRPYLYPLPVATFFGLIFWGIATQQFVQTVTTMTV